MSSKVQLPKVIGHRGACHFAPENTLASLAKAKELGVAWVELDAMLTGDEEVIVMHDQTVNRTTNGQGEVSQMSYADLAKLDAGSWFGSEFSGERVPTLSDFLGRAAELAIGVNVEIKSYQGRDRQTAFRVIEILNQHDFTNGIIVSSFSWESLAVARALSEVYPLAMILDHWTADWQEYIRQLACFSVHVAAGMLTPKIVDQVKSLDVRLAAYTVNSPEQAAKLFAWGVDAVFSDCINQGDYF